RLKISFINKVNTIFITKFIPQRLLGIMRSTYSIYIQLLHKLKITHHYLACYYLACVGIKFMQVYTFKENFLSVYKQLTVCNFYFTETNLMGCGFNYTTLLIF